MLTGTPPSHRLPSLLPMTDQAFTSVVGTLDEIRRLIGMPGWTMRPLGLEPGECPAMGGQAVLSGAHSAQVGYLGAEPYVAEMVNLERSWVAIYDCPHESMDEPVLASDPHHAVSLSGGSALPQSAPGIGRCRALQQPLDGVVQNGSHISVARHEMEYTA